MSIFSNLRDTLTQAPTRLAPQDFVQRRAEDSVVLDVRTPGEFAGGHLEGARNLDVTRPRFREEVAQLDDADTYYLYCRTGNRSGQAARIMRGMGYDAYDIGGLRQLFQAGAAIAQ